MTVSWEDPILRLGAACILGALVGFERQIHQRTAGLRTNMLVSLGAAGFTLFGTMFYEGDSVGRIVAQIVSGIGFLGAGAIMREGLTVHGLNTAATLWCSATLGIFSGAGYYVAAVIFALFIVLTNTLLRRLENYMDKHPVVAQEMETHYLVHIVCSQAHNKDLRETLLRRMRHRHFILKQLQIKALDNLQVAIEALFRTKGIRDQSIEHVIEDISLDPDIQHIEWRIVHPKEE